MIEILRSGNLIEISPLASALHLLRPLLTFKRAYRDPKNRTGRPSFKTEALGRILDDGVAALFPAGLTTRICNLLRSNKIEYQINDLRDELMPLPRFDLLGGLRHGQADVLVKISAHDRGVIVAPTAFGKSHIIVDICRMYPNVPIVIAAKGLPVVNTIYERLVSAFPRDEVGLVTGGKHRKGLITVVSTGSLLRAPIDECKLFLFDEVHTCAAPKISEELAYVRNARMFGFTASPKGRSDHADVLIEAIFGPVIHQIEYQEAQAAGSIAPIDVRLYEVTGTPIYQKQPTSRNRHGIWRNVNRNNIIVSAAREFTPDDQVLITVQTKEHAFRLRELLSEFVVACDTMGREGALDALAKGWITQEEFDSGEYRNKARRTEMRKDFESNKLKKVIATPIWNVGVDFIHLKVLIRGDGMAGEIPAIQIPGRLSRMSEGKNRGLLIDFLDEFDPMFLRRSKKRISFYRRKGWTVIFPQ